MTAYAPRNAAASGGGGSVTIYGLNFGSSDTGLTPSVSVSGTACSYPERISDSEIRCPSTPSGSGSSKTIAVTVGGLVGTGPAAFGFDGAPTSASHCVAARGGADLACARMHAHTRTHVLKQARTQDARTRTHAHSHRYVRAHNHTHTRRERECV